MKCDLPVENNSMLDSSTPIECPVPNAFGSVMVHPFVWRDVRTIPLRKWILGNSLLRGSLSLLVAPGGSGKTALTAGIAVSLATGRNLLGMKVWGGPKTVLVWNLEDSREEIDKLLYAAFKKWEVVEADIADRLYVNSGLDGDILVTATDSNGKFALHQNVLDDLTRLISARGIDVLIVDPFVSSHQVSENDNGAIDAVAKAWANLANATGCSVLLVHHSSKLRGNENTSESSRGASALVNAARSVITINRMNNSEAGKLGIKEHEKGRYFRCYDDKNNRAPSAAKAEWFTLESVSLGNHPLGCSGDSVPVVVPWSAQVSLDDVTSAQIREVQSKISDGHSRRDAQSPQWIGNVIANVLGRDLTDKNIRTAVTKLIAQWMLQGFLAVEIRMDRTRTNRPFIVPGKIIL